MVLTMIMMTGTTSLIPVDSLYREIILGDRQCLVYLSSSYNACLRSALHGVITFIFSSFAQCVHAELYTKV